MSIDAAATRWVNSTAGQGGSLDAIMIGLTHFGVPLLALFVALNWWSQKERDRVRHTCVAAAFSLLLGLGVNQIIVQFVRRIRPYEAGVSHLIIGPNADWSFPSDHATASFAIAATFLFAGLKRRGTALMVVAVLVSASRIFVGAHYVTDVLGGAVTGLFAAAAVRVAYRPGTPIDRLLTSVL